MDYLNGLLNGLPKWTTLNYLAVLVDLRHLFFLNAAGQLFCRRIHSSRVMADTLDEFIILYRRFLAQDGKSRRYK